MNTKTVIILLIVAAVVGAIIYISQKSNAPTVTQNANQTTGLTSLLNTSGASGIFSSLIGLGKRGNSNTGSALQNDLANFYGAV